MFKRKKILNSNILLQILPKKQIRKSNKYINAVYAVLFVVLLAAILYPFIREGFNLHQYLKGINLIAVAFLFVLLVLSKPFEKISAKINKLTFTENGIYKAGLLAICWDEIGLYSIVSQGNSNQKTLYLEPKKFPYHIKYTHVPNSLRASGLWFTNEEANKIENIFADKNIKKSKG